MNRGSRNREGSLRHRDIHMQKTHRMKVHADLGGVSSIIAQDSLKMKMHEFSIFQRDGFLR